ncbi:hypothetical protein VNO80_16087 [Phaseolus coccineus]|uniref:Uncharacterized protein n=1 Tax=Phaseolus coccineus TaxID=3886 RepID=A0AAN9R3K4_PHACN
MAILSPLMERESLPLARNVIRTSWEDEPCHFFKVLYICRCWGESVKSKSSIVKTVVLETSLVNTALYMCPTSIHTVVVPLGKESILNLSRSIQLVRKRQRRKNN